MLIEQIIMERFVNLIGNDERKDQYKDEVYDLLQKAYADIGGLKGSGLSTPDEIKTIPFWKLAVKDGKIVAVVLYKDKNGRKAIALGNDGTLAGKRAIVNIVKSEPERSYAEKSKAALGFFIKSLKNDGKDPKDFLVFSSKVSDILKKDIMPIKGLEEWPVSDQEKESTQATLNKYPFLIDYGYFREISGEMLFKVMVGTPYKKIQ